MVDGWGPELHHIYGVNAIAINTEHAYLCCHIPNCNHVFYSYYLESCSYCLGCIWLKNREYCIFNKQYTKEERHIKANEIFTHMEKDCILGEFFPSELNPFYHNDTVAALIEDFTKEEIESEWYLRRDKEIKVDIPEWMEVVEVKDLGEYEWWQVGMEFFPSASFEWKTPPPSGHLPLTGEKWDWWSWYIDPSILKKVIRDEEGNVYRVIKMEYDFLVRYGLPLPRKHWLKRLKGHFRK